MVRILDLEECIRRFIGHHPRPDCGSCWPACGPGTPFPANALYKSLGIEPRLNDAEIERILGYAYQGRYTNLVLSLLYPDRDWKDAVFHEDHIFPQSEFSVRGLTEAEIRRREDCGLHGPLQHALQPPVAH